MTLGERMKMNYEFRTQTYIPRRTNMILRIDGRAFHTWVKQVGCIKPFDQELMKTMDDTTIQLMKEIQGSRVAYSQSDEISILVTDYEKETTESFFDGNIQKICSVVASMTTAIFNQKWMENKKEYHDYKPATFDCRVFSIPDPIEVMNYFYWRYLDNTRNSLSSYCQINFSHKQLQNKNQYMQHEMLHNIGKNWAKDLTEREKNGALIVCGGQNFNLNKEEFKKWFELFLPEYGYDKK